MKMTLVRGVMAARMRVRVDLEVVFHAAGDLDRHAARQDHFGLIGDKTGGGDDDFVAGVEQGGHGQIQRLGNATVTTISLDRIVFHAVQAFADCQRCPGAVPACRELEV